MSADTTRIEAPEVRDTGEQSLPAAGRFFLETVLYAVPHERAPQSPAW